MDGSGIDFVIMPVIIIPCLVLWLGGIYYAAAHPKWRDAPSSAPPDVFQRHILVVSDSVHVPAPRTPVVLSEADGADRSEEKREATAH